MVHKAMPLGGSNLKSITISASGDGTQGSGHKRSCSCTIENLGFKTWEASCSPSGSNSTNYLYGITSAGKSVLLADLKYTKSGTFENTDEYVSYRGYCHNGDDYYTANVTITLYF